MMMMLTWLRIKDSNTFGGRKFICGPNVGEEFLLAIVLKKKIKRFE